MLWHFVISTLSFSITKLIDMAFQEDNGPLGVPWSVASNTDSNTTEPANGAEYTGPAGYTPGANNNSSGT